MTDLNHDLGQPTDPDHPLDPGQTPGAGLRRLSTIVGRYLSATVIGVVANLTIYLSLVRGLDLDPPAANLIAALSVIGPRFWLIKIWVWNHRRTDRVAAEVGAHGVLTLVGLGLSTFVAWALARSDAGAALLAIGNVAAFGLIWVVRFVISHRYLFVDSPGADRAVESSEMTAGDRAEGCGPVAVKGQTLGRNQPQRR
jgi:putative flippase GtrA